MSDSLHAKRHRLGKSSDEIRSRPGQPKFSRAALLIVSFVVCIAVLLANWLFSGARLSPTMQLFSVLLALLVVVPLGAFIRNGFRVRLWSVFVVMTLLAVLLGLLGGRWHRARVQRQAIASIRALEKRPLPTLNLPGLMPITANVSFDYYRGNDIGGEFVKTPGGLIVPNWLVNLLGEDFFLKTWQAVIQGIDLSGPDALVATELEHFDTLVFEYCDFGPEGIRRLAETRQLQRLTLFSCNINDRNLAELAKLPQLETLFLARTKVTGTGLTAIAQLSSLKSLWLHEAQLSSGELGALASLRQLESLNIAGNQLLTNEDFQFLKELPSLTGINLRGTAANEGILPMLRELPNLRWATITASSPQARELLKQQEENRDEGLEIFVE